MKTTPEYHVADEVAKAFLQMCFRLFQGIAIVYFILWPLGKDAPLPIVVSWLLIGMCFRQIIKIVIQAINKNAQS